MKQIGSIFTSASLFEANMACTKMYWLSKDQSPACAQMIGLRKPPQSS